MKRCLPRVLRRKRNLLSSSLFQALCRARDHRRFQTHWREDPGHHILNFCEIARPILVLRRRHSDENQLRGVHSILALFPRVGVLVLVVHDAVVTAGSEQFLESPSYNAVPYDPDSHSDLPSPCDSREVTIAECYHVPFTAAGMKSRMTMRANFDDIDPLSTRASSLVVAQHTKRHARARHRLSRLLHRWP